MALEAKLKKNKKISLPKTFGTKMKKKLCFMKVPLKSIITWTNKAEKEKADLDLAIKEAMDSGGKRVMDRYKGSGLFRSEISKAAIESYFIDFEDYQAKAIQLFLNLDFNMLVMDIREEAKEGEILKDVGVDHPIEPASIVTWFEEVTESAGTQEIMESTIT